DRKPSPIPITPFGMPHQQTPELVDAGCNFLHHQPLSILQAPILARQLVQAQHSVITGMIGIVAGWAATNAVAVSDGEVIGNRDRFAMRDQVSLIGALDRRPAADAGGRAWPQQVDRRARAEIVAAPIRREMSFMRSPAELGRL